MGEWQPVETMPNDRRVLVDFKGAGPIVAYRNPKWPDELVRYLGYGKSASWPAVHVDFALGWMDLPAPAAARSDQPDLAPSSAKPAVDDSSRDDLNSPHPITAKGLS